MEMTVPMCALKRTRHLRGTDSQQFQISGYSVFPCVAVCRGGMKEVSTVNAHSKAKSVFWSNTGKNNKRECGNSRLELRSMIIICMQVQVCGFHENVN